MVTSWSCIHPLEARVPFMDLYMDIPTLTERPSRQEQLTSLKILSNASKSLQQLGDPGLLQTMNKAMLGKEFCQIVLMLITISFVKMFYGEISWR